MKNKLTSIVSLLVISFSVYSATIQDVNDEINGTTIGSASATTPSSQNRQIAMATMLQTGLLLVPDSSNDRVMAFDPITGDLLDPDFIPSDPAHLSTPIQAILSADGQSFLVSDQIEDVVQQYDLDGNYIGVFAPAGGVDLNILDNIRGITLDNSGNLLVTVASGANQDSVARFDTSGNYTGNFVANASGGIDSPFDIIIRSNGEALAGGINSDAIHRYDAAGNYISDFSSVDTFPEQIFETTSGNILVANFSGTQEGILEYASDGTFIGLYNPAAIATNYRGVYELPNGNILVGVSAGGAVHEIDRLGNVIDTKITGVGARFISYVGPAQAQEILPVPALSFGAMAGMILLLLILGIYQGKKIFG